jgi:hypothetical protein
VYWSFEGRDDVARVHDVGMGGVFIETKRAREVGSKANLHFLVQEGQIRADAVVRHTVEGRGLGLKFTAVSEEDRRQFAALLVRLRSAA